MSKERLELAINHMKGVQELLVNSDEEASLRLIIEQAERVQELESIISQNESVVAAIVGEEVLHQEDIYETEMQKLTNQNKNYREALEFYVNKNNYPWLVYQPIQNKRGVLLDGGARAQVAINKARKIKEALEGNS